jgi:PH (Pleckstrin Homology) domain-containing protein
MRTTMPGRQQIPCGRASVRKVTFGPPRARAISLLAGVLASVAAAFFIPEFGALAVVLAFFAVRDLRFRTTLELDDEGFDYVAGFRRESASWLQVTDVRVRQERHWLSFGKVLEIDMSDDALIVLSGMQLGADAETVAPIVEERWQEALRSAQTS